jgi:hypothetical protein
MYILLFASAENTDNPPRIACLLPSTAIKRSSQPHPLSPPLTLHFIFPPPYSEHNAIKAPPVVVVPFHRRSTPIIPPHNDTNSDELADPLLLLEPRRHCLCKSMLG